MRGYISKVLGPDYLFPLLGQWDSFSDIDFDKLPDQFVLKCNHDSGSVKVVQDKGSMDKWELERFFNARLRMNPYVLGREYPYRNVKPCIIAEKYMEAKDGKGINDYKFLCFHGCPKIMYIATDRATDVKFDFYNMQGQHLKIRNTHDNAETPPEIPECFEEMKQLAQKLSQGKKFVRVDFYEIDGRVYFGEFTFFHCGGFYPFYPEEWEKKLGDWIHL